MRRVERISRWRGASSASSSTTTVCVRWCAVKSACLFGCLSTSLPVCLVGLFSSLVCFAARVDARVFASLIGVFELALF